MIKFFMEYKIIELLTNDKLPKDVNVKHLKVNGKH